jgi:UDPglucose--hexose-1-phosphate uridylyltransferase
MLSAFCSMLLKDMSELRRDPITGRWVIVSIERGKRPTDFISPSSQRKRGGLPILPWE